MLMIIGEATLIEYALDTLPVKERAEVDAALRADRLLRETLADLVETLGGFFGGHGAAPAPPTLRERIVTCVSEDYPGFRSRVAALFQIDEQRAAHYLALLLRAPEEPWQPSPTAGVLILPVPDAGCRDSAFFIYLAPGCVVPRHRHQGAETMLVIDGYAIESCGRRLGPGSMVRSDQSVEHDFVIQGDVPCWFAVTLEGRLEYV
jgi:anti-sigma factor ChrR (cupin superfamily)